MVSIQLSDTLGSRLATEAQRRGVDASRFASELLERALAQPSADEILAPFRKQVFESGLSDEQLDSLFEEAREDVWDARSKST